ncbi:LCP family protein [Streptomyces indicus]|uniref:Cell envelope-related function transcriptional attenuator common domain-containing protein n=1 Tax=Streptomyces indicus TaxID=417292 RepID=A0A1G9I2T6_9ACTN|nr:LCP family protein [Streptomyces indicus]SDL19541.1 cell envelope-related function transcriptional attenuator common domain-containing protein [Streptomyces indicus]
MTQNSVRGNGRGARRSRAPHARDLGWDDSLYEGEREGSGVPGPRGPGDGEPSTRSARRRAARRPRSRRRKVLRWSAVVFAVLILGTAGAGYLYYQHLNDNIQTKPLPDKNRAPKATPNAAGQTPLNILLIGSDDRNSEENLRLGGHKDSVGAKPLADVQMLLHLSADRSNMSVVSMPRDTLLDIPACEDPDTGEKFQALTRHPTNESLGRGGPACTVLTWEKLTGIRIDHFMMVDFTGVVSMADAIGGVPVCVDANIHSRTRDGKGSGLKLEEGTTEIKGEQALQWLRTRYGFEDGSDIARAKAQHMYMNSMVRELKSSARLTNPTEMLNLAEAAIDAIVFDESLNSVQRLASLGGELQKVPTSRINMTTMPFNYVGVKVEPKPGEAEDLFELVREDVALDGKGAKKKEELSDDPAASPADTEVAVLNASGDATRAPLQGRATAVAELLKGKGYTGAAAVQPQAGDDTSQDRTVIRFPRADLEGDAQVLAKSLGLPMSSVKESADVPGVTLIVGADWREGDVPPKPAPKAVDKEQLSNGADKGACMKVDPNYTWK